MVNTSDDVEFNDVVDHEYFVFYDENDLFHDLEDNSCDYEKMGYGFFVMESFRFIAGFVVPFLIISENFPKAFYR